MTKVHYFPEDSYELLQPVKQPITEEQYDAWIAALRSGEFRQGRSYLKMEYPNDPPAYCCLGVLCEITGTQSVSSKYISDGKWASDPDAVSLLIPYVVQTRLAGLNDNEGLGFEAIAQELEDTKAEFFEFLKTVPVR